MRIYVRVETCPDLISREIRFNIPTHIHRRVRVPITTSWLSFSCPYPGGKFFLQCVQIGMPLRLKIRSFQTIRSSDRQRANILLAMFPDIETNIFLGDKNTPISAINDAVILFKTRKARERRLRAATRALPALCRTLRRAHTATGVDVSRKNLSISAIENSGLRSARDG